MGKPRVTKDCQFCGCWYYPTGRCQKYCSTCSPAMVKKAHREKHLKTYVARGYPSPGPTHPQFKNGIGIYRRMKKKESCEVCKSTLHLLIHHKDGDRRNNDLNNLQVLCKRCHQDHHCKRGKDGRYQ